jgi:hypothetical protein
MRWILESYSDVYLAAMMQSHKVKHDAAPAKERVHAKHHPLFAFLSRR